MCRSVCKSLDSNKNTNCHMCLHTFTHLGAAAQCGRKRERADFHWLNLLEGNALEILFIFVIVLFSDEI